MTEVREAYSVGASAWAIGPERVYGRLAELLVQSSPVPFAGRRVLDLGAGTGAGSRAALDAGASVVAVDLALGMLRLGQDARPPAAVGDAVCLPFADASFDVVLAPFSLNHLDDPAVPMREAARTGGVLLASTYAVDDDHPAKAAVDTAMLEAGWVRPAWHASVKEAMAGWGTVDAAAAVVDRAGLRCLTAEHRAVAFPELGPRQMVAWRMGLAMFARFLARRAPAEIDALEARALELLGPDPEPVVRRVIFLAAQASGSAPPRSSAEERSQIER